MQIIAKTKKIQRYNFVLAISIWLVLLFMGSTIYGATETPTGTTVSCENAIVTATTKEIAESKNLEVTYPGVRGAEKLVVPVKTGTEALPIFIKYIFYLAIAISGFIAFGALVYGGIKYITSAGNPTAMEEGKKAIIAAFLGIIVLLSAGLLLNTINPTLISLKLEKISVQEIQQKIGILPGVYLIGSETETVETPDKILTIKKNVGTTKNIPALASYEFDNKTKELCIQPFNIQSNIRYHAILHSEENYGGSCRIFYNVWNVGNIEGKGVGGNVTNDVSSVQVFTTKIFNERPGEDFSQDFAVRLYKNSNLAGDPNNKNEVCTIKNETTWINPITGDVTLRIENIEDACPGFTGNDINSLEVGHGWILAAFEKGGGSGKCETFGSEKVPEIRTHPIGRCLGPKGFFQSCIKSISVFKGLVAE